MNGCEGNSPSLQTIANNENFQLMRSGAWWLCNDSIFPLNAYSNTFLDPNWYYPWNVYAEELICPFN